MDTIERRFNRHISFVKAVAITLIILWHFDDVRYAKGLVPSLNLAESLDRLMSLHPADMVIGLASSISILGYLGASLFFMISGYGLYLSYLKRPFRWRDFYIRRALRILPLYWLAVIVIYLLKYRYGIISFRSFLSHMLLVQAFTPYYLDFASLWFVGVLVCYYLAFPLMVLLFSRKGLKWLFVAVSFIANYALLKALAHYGYRFEGILPTASLQFFVTGMLLAEAVYRGWAPLRKVFSAYGGGLAIVVLAALLYMERRAHFPSNHTLECLLLFVSLALPFSLISRHRQLFTLVEKVAYASFVSFLINFDVIVFLMRFLKRHAWLDYIMLTDSVTYFTSEGQLAMVMPLTMVSIWGISYFIQDRYDRLVLKRPAPRMR